MSYIHTNSVVIVQINNNKHVCMHTYMYAYAYGFINVTEHVWAYVYVQMYMCFDCTIPFMQGRQ